jgi:ABC-type uncharacterized transport system substrate-binding protein
VAICSVWSAPAFAHPHIWVTAKAELVYTRDGKVWAVRHIWTFDAAYSSFLTQGLDANNDGKLSSNELQGLAKINTDALADFDYFTQLKANGVKQAFDPPHEPRMVFENGAATLAFDLPLKKPAGSKMVTLEVFDPAYYVDFAISTEADGVKLAAAPQGCVTTITRPKPIDLAQQQRLSEAFFQALTAASAFGASQASRVIVACP